MRADKTQTVVFTDLDGTLLGADYRPGPARAAVADLSRRGIPVIFCSSKTAAEQAVIWADLGVCDPFIVENGAALLVPEGYFDFDFDAPQRDGYQVIEFGVSYAEIRSTLLKLRQAKGVKVRGYGDMSLDEVSALTGLDPAAARRAQARQYSETVIFEGDAAAQVQALGELTAAGLECLPGSRFHSLQRGADKGRAARYLIDFYRRRYGAMRSVGIGDSANDVSLLRAVDLPVLVRRPDDSWFDLDLPGLRRTDGIGPAGFAEAVNELVGLT